MPSAGFETAIPALKQLQTHALDRAATGIRPRIINLVNTWRQEAGFEPRLSNRRRKAPNIHCLAGWIGLTAGLESVE